MLKSKKPTKGRSGTRKTEKSAAKTRKKSAGRKKKPVVRKSAPAKKVSLRKKAVARKKVSKKTVQTISTSSGARKKGRPVSVEVLQRKLAESITSLKVEKQKRQQLAKKAKESAKASVTERRRLKKQIAELKNSLTQMQAEKRSSDKQAVQQQKMEIARNEAVGRFLERWERDYQKKTNATVKRKRVKRRRRKAS